MNSCIQQLPTTAFTALIVLVQCVAPLQSACGCSEDSVSSAELQTDESPKSCCSSVDSCCSKSECTCGSECGTGSTGCKCGCSDGDDTPDPAQKPEQKSQQDVKVLSRANNGDTVVARLNAVSKAAKSLPQSERGARRVQVLLCTWQT